MYKKIVYRFNPRDLNEQAKLENLLSVVGELENIETTVDTQSDYWVDVQIEFEDSELQDQVRKLIDTLRVHMTNLYVSES